MLKEVRRWKDNVKDHLDGHSISRKYIILLVEILSARKLSDKASNVNFVSIYNKFTLKQI